jgi:rhomboid family GlyGly-CTERM serine protease
VNRSSSAASEDGLQPAWKASIGPVSIALLAIAAGTGGSSLRLFARYDRSALANGELWRLLSGHFVHLSLAHLIMNLAALAALALLFSATLKAADWVLIALASALAIDAGLYGFHPDIAWYVGLSGILHGFWLGGALQGAMLRQPMMRWLLAILALKLAYEAVFGPMPFSADTAGGPVVVVAHAYGSLGGAAWYICVSLVRRLRCRKL